HSVPHHRAPHFARNRYTEPRCGGPIRQQEHEECIARKLAAARLHRSIQGPLTNSLIARESLASLDHGLLLGDGHRQPPASFATPARKGEATATGLHALAKPMAALAALVMRLIGAFHDGSPCRNPGTKAIAIDSSSVKIGRRKRRFADLRHSAATDAAKPAWR